MKSLRCAEVAAHAPALEIVVARQGEPLPDRALARFAFGSSVPGESDPRDIVLHLGEPAFGAGTEVWLGQGPVETGTLSGFRYAHDGSLLFATLQIPDGELTDVEAASRAAYVHLHGVLARTGYPHRLRIWNYLSRITEGTGDAERYRMFNVGRHGALALHPSFESQLPAASAIGTRAGGLTLCCLAGKHAGIQVENPRQVSAFRYPRRYGPRSPSFSRATWLPHYGGRLLVSGTASIVGHESLHPSDPVAQLEETARNMRALIAEALDGHGAPDGGIDEVRAEALRVYLRPPLAAESIRPHVERLFGERTPCIHVQGEICRTELDIEIEGVFVLPPAQAGP